MQASRNLRPNFSPFGSHIYLSGKLLQESDKVTKDDTSKKGQSGAQGLESTNKQRWGWDVIKELLQHHARIKTNWTIDLKIEERTAMKN